MPKVVAPGVVEEKAERCTIGEIVFRAERLRDQWSGVHARLTIFHNTTMMAYGKINIEDPKPRKTLSNDAHKALGPNRDAVIDKADLLHELDVFTTVAFETLINADGIDESEVDPMVPINFIAKPHVLEGAGTIMFGERGSLKSYTAILMGVAVDAGLNGFWQTTQRNTLLVNLERSADSISRRIGCINSALGLDPSRPLRRLNRSGSTLPAITPLLRRIVPQHNIGLLIIDSLSRTGTGDLNENQPANETMDTLNSLGCSWLAIAHPPRSNKDHVFGSTMFENAADVIVKVTHEVADNKIGVRLGVTKANDIAFPPPMTLTYAFDDFGPTEVRLASKNEFNLGLEHKDTAEETIYGYLLEEKGKATATLIAKDLGLSRSRVSHILNNDDRFIEVAQVGREKFYGVLRQ